MKKLAIGSLLLFAIATGVNAQDFKKVRSALILSQMKGGESKIEEAKTEYDKASADPKAQGKAETYLLKAEIYGTIAGDETLRAKYPNAGTEALEALKKYLELEPSGEKYKEDNYMGVNGIYTSFFNAGVKDYNAKSWETAFNNFKQLVDISDIMIKNKWTTVTFDTTGYLYAGITAQNAKKEDEAVKYYQRIADMKLKGSDYEHIYVFLPQYYTGKKDETNFAKYVAIGKAVYPEKTFWGDMEFEYNTANLSLDEMAKRFDEQVAANKLTATSAMDFGNFFFNDKRIKELKPDEKKQYTDRAAKAFAKAYELDPNNALAAYNVAVTNYVIWEDAADAASAIKGVTPEIKSKRAAADKVAIAASDNAIAALEKAYQQLTAKAEKTNVEKNSQKTAAKFLAVLYSWRRDKAKGKAAEYDAFDKKFQFYDKQY